MKRVLMSGGRKDGQYVEVSENATGVRDEHNKAWYRRTDQTVEVWEHEGLLSVPTATDHTG